MTKGEQRVLCTYCGDVLEETDDVDEEMNEGDTVKCENCDIEFTLERAVQEVEKEWRKCPECGTRNTATRNACGRCGEDISDVEIESETIIEDQEFFRMIPDKSSFPVQCPECGHELAEYGEVSDGDELSCDDCEVEYEVEREEGADPKIQEV